MKSRYKQLLNAVVLVSVLQFAGCNGYPTCKITFKNESPELIWVDSLRGVRDDGGVSSCGNLRPGGTAGINGVNAIASLPETAEITWWIGGGAERPSDSSKILKFHVDLPRKLPRNHEIVFVYNAKQTWTAKLEN